MKKFFLAIALFINLLPSSICAKDLGIHYGVPTPALAMYAAQTKFAINQCIADGLIDNAKGAASFQKFFDRGIFLSGYKEKDEEFVENYNTFLANYAAAWSSGSSEQRLNFCDALNGEIEFKSKRFSGLKLSRWFGQILYFRDKFSPLSEMSLERQKKMQKIASVLSFVSAAATTTASISASHDAIVSAKSGDWTASMQKMDMSRSFNQVGESMILSGSLSTTISSQVTSVLEVGMVGAKLKIARCPVIDHFYGFSAPIESSVWITYQNVWMPCRDPRPSDFEPVE